MLLQGSDLRARRGIAVQRDAHGAFRPVLLPGRYGRLPRPVVRIGKGSGVLPVLARLPVAWRD
ncbi:MAG: hypothetical protein SVO96_09360 [Pseudomonadota bacterium]|nr:hypothetical protein [Pseudomonadota bacterium]